MRGERGTEVGGQCALEDSKRPNEESMQRMEPFERPMLFHEAPQGDIVVWRERMSRPLNVHIVGSCGTVLQAPNAFAQAPIVAPGFAVASGIPLSAADICAPPACGEELLEGGSTGLANSNPFLDALRCGKNDPSGIGALEVECHSTAFSAKRGRASTEKVFGYEYSPKEWRNFGESNTPVTVVPMTPQEVMQIDFLLNGVHLGNVRARASLCDILKGLKKTWPQRRVGKVATGERLKGGVVLRQRALSATGWL